MRRLAVLALLVSAAAHPYVPAAAADATLTLSCVGYNRALGGTMEWVAEFYPGYAMVNSQRLALVTTPTAYELTGRMFDGRQMVDGKITINRLNGSYTMAAGPAPGPLPEWARPQDAGCAPAKPKF
jgi:hypothetical protein